MKDNDFIIETILGVAKAEIAKAVKRGKLGEAINKVDIARDVARDMELTEAETKELIQRVVDTPAAEMPTPEDLQPNANVINFKSPSDVDQAAGMLMYKNIPWRIKSANPAFISFDDPTILAEAREVLKRRWDFLEHSNRTVACIEFDNLDEYNKVLEFIRKSKFTTLANATSDLSEDILDEITIKVAKAGKAPKIKESDIGAKHNSYDAIEKNFSRLDDKTFNTKIPADRSIKVRKKWK